MANIFLLTTIVIVVSSFVNCDRTAFLRNVNSLKQPVPLHLRHDQEESKRNMVKDQGQPRRNLRMGLLEPLLSWPLGPNHQNKEQTEERIRQLQNKLTPSKNIIPIRTLNQPLQKPDNEVKLYENKRHKREAIGLDNNNRQKRDVVINSVLRPEVMMQPHVQPSLVQHNEVKNARPDLNFFIYNPSIYYPGVIDALSNITGHHQEAEDTPEKRDKRQILLMIKQQPLVFRKKARTTPNPFIRETNIADYDIVKTDVDKAEIDLIDTMDTNSYQLGRPQSLFQYLQSLLFKVGWTHPSASMPITKAEYVNEELHIRVKRRMSKLRRDRKQMTRKRKIGRRKKTKVRRAPIKLKKWYNKRFEKEKKGDGTYRGGRGRIPRQHKRPRNYKPPQNETSDYDYYDSDGNIREPSGETQEGSDDAAYVSYGTGEYADTAEAEAAQQELEKEYQMQLVRERKRAQRRRLSNGTIESTEEVLSLPLIESNENVTNTTKSEEEEYYDDYEEGEKEESEEYEDSSDSGSSFSGGRKKKRKGYKHIKIKPRYTRKPSKTREASNRIPSLTNTLQDQIKHIGTNIKSSETVDPKQFEGLVDSATKKRHSQNIRKAAKKFDFVSESKIPGHSNSLLPNQPSKWTPSAKFRIAQDKIFNNLQSITKKKIPDVNSITNVGISSMGGKDLQSLQAKKVFRVIESTSRDKKLNLTSTAGEKLENDFTFTSKTKDRRKKLTSIGNTGLKRLQSLAVDPLVLTSIAKHIPEIEVETEEVKDAKNLKTKIEKTKKTNGLNELSKKVINNQEIKSVKVKRDTKINLGDEAKRHKLNMQSSDSGTYEELSSLPDKDLGLSVPSEELESAPDDE